MKKLLQLIIVIILLSLTTLAQEDWFWVNPQPQGNNLRDVFVLDENTIIAVGDRGTLLHSENGGDDWEITYRLLDMDEDIVDLQFISEQKGYLLGNDPSSKILLTEDKGINWKVIAEFDSLKLKDLFFIDENIGWAIGCSDGRSLTTGMILKSINGGHTWDTIYVEPNINGSWSAYSKIQFIDSETGWAAGRSNDVWVGDSELLKTNDAGITWSPVCQSLEFIMDFQFVNAEIGYLNNYWVGWGNDYTSIKKSTDGGESWFDILGGIIYGSGAAFLPLYFINPETGWVSFENSIHKTTDGGSSWSTIAVNLSNGGSIHFGNELNGCVVSGCGGIFTTSNVGQSWDERSTLLFSTPVVAVDFCTENLGWMTDYTITVIMGGEWYEYNGRIYRTTNGGNSWEEQLYIQGWANSDGIINDIQSIDNNTIYAVGRNVYKTTNSGTSWTTLDYLEVSVYKTLFFLNANTGFVGSEGLVFKTTDGGTQWDTVLAISAESIFFTNNSMGWLVNGHNIYKTSDEGNNWQLQWINISYLKSISFRDENVGLAVGDDGTIIQTFDGGSTWDEIWNKEGYELKSVCFTDSNKAVAVGQGNGEGIIVSIDNVGGDYSIKWESWTPELNDICFNNNIGWAVGDGGTIIKTGSGPTLIEEEEINEILTNYSLSNNYPNPFNPNTKIKYSVPQLSNVIIKVFDILGNEIETLVNEEKQVGTYEIIWYAEGLPSGIYFYRLQADEFIKTKKMVLVK